MPRQSRSPSQNSASHGHPTGETIPDRLHKRQSQRDARNPAVMLCDPLDGPSSDALPFHEDEMYGSDSDVETIGLYHQSELSDEHTVCTLPVNSM